MSTNKQTRQFYLIENSEFVYIFRENMTNSKNHIITKFFSNFEKIMKNKHLKVNAQLFAFLKTTLKDNINNKKGFPTCQS